MSAVPAKIVLKSTTKVTLSDRFTQIQKIRPPPASPQEVRVQMAENQQSSQLNRRLAQQMANRPAVQAALGIPSRQQPKQQQSLMQRLGPTNVKARLSLDNSVVGRGRRGAQQRGGFRGGRGLQNGSFRGNNRGYATVRGRGFGGRGRGGFLPRWLDDGRPRGRGGFGRPGGGRQYFRGGGRGAAIGGRGDGIDRGFGRGQWGRFRGRGRRGGQRGKGRGGASQPEVSKEQLDNQLEEYMAKTKSHLDQELDQYMADANH